MTPQTLESPLALKLKEVLREKIIETTDYRGDLTLLIDKNDIVDVCKKIRDHSSLKFEQIIDLTAVDYLEMEKPTRFQVVYHFLSLTYLHRLRIKCNVDEKDPVIPTISSLWAIVNWYEREVFDFYGIKFTGHPDMRRILMQDDFEGHPLRKDYFIGHEQPVMELKDVSERNEYMEDYSK